MEKSFLLLSAPLITLLVHAEEPEAISGPQTESIEQVVQNPIEEQAEQFQPRAKPRRLMKVVKQKPKPEQYLAQDENQDNSMVTPPQETHMMPMVSEDRLKDLECKVQRLQEQMCECCQPFASQPDQSFYVIGELLYWKFTEGGTDYAINNIATPLADTVVNIPNGHNEKVEFDWEAGFRVGAGYHFCEKGWDIFLSYSQVSPDGDANSHGIIFPLLVYQDNFPVYAVTSAKADWDIDFKSLDFEIGRKFNIHPTLTFRPFMGLKAARIHQHVKFTYFNKNPDTTIGNSFAAVIPAGEADYVKEKNNFEGIGLRLGMDTLWQISKCYGFSLYGKAAASLLASRIEIEQKQEQWRPSGSSTDPLDFLETVDLKSNFHPLLPVVELAFGVEWARALHCDQYRIQLHAGIEGQYWWRQNYLERFTPGPSSAPDIYVRPSEDLGIYGLHVGARFDF